MDKQIQEYLSRLTNDPRDLHALDDLQDTFAKGERWGELANLLAEQATRADDPELKARLLVQTGEVVGFRMGNVDTATSLFQQALELNGSGGAELDAQIGLLRLQGDWQSVLELHQRVLQTFELPAFKSRALYRMGEVYRDHMGDRSNAMKAFQNAFKVDRGCYRALEAARRIYADVQNWELVGKLYTLEIKQRSGDGSAPEAVAQLMAELGDVLRLHMDDAQKAAGCYKQALNYDITNAMARAGLESLGVAVPPLPEGAEAPAEGDEVEAVEAEAVEAGEPEAVEADADADDDVEVVEAEADEEADAPEAAEAEGVEVVDEAEAADEAEAVEGAEADAPEAAEADDAEGDADNDEAEVVEVDVEEAEVDEADAASEGDEAEVVEVDVEEADVVSEGAEAEAVEAEAVEAEEEADEADEAVEAAEADEADEASEATEAVEAEAGDEAEAAEDAPEVSEAKEADEAEVADASEAEAPAAPAKKKKPTWLDKAAAFAAQGDEYGSDPEALDAYRQALGLYMTHAPADEAVVSLVDRSLGAVPGFDGVYESVRGRLPESQWGPIYKAYERRASAADDAEVRASLQRQMVRIRLYEQGDVPEAQMLVEVLMASGHAGEVVKELADAKAAAGGSWRRLQQELQSRHEDLGAEEKAQAVWGRIGELARGLGHQDRELDALRHLVQESPRDMAARRRLKRLYADAEKWNAYLSLLQEEVEFPDDVEEQVAILREMVTLYREKMRQDVLVVKTLDQILKLQPDNTEVMDELAEQYEGMRRFPDLIGVLQQRVELAEDDEERVELNLRIARLFLDKFSNQAEAIKAFEAVLEVDPGHEEAIEQLKEMYKRRRDWEKLIEVNLRQLERVDDPAVKIAGLKDAATMATRQLRKPPVATELWLKVLELDPNELEALDALETLYEREKDWESLAGISERKLDQLESDRDKLKLAEKLGRLYSDRLDDTDSAIRTWKRVLSLDANNRKAQDSLKRLLIDIRDWDALEVFYAGRDDYKGLVRVLETLAGTNKDEPEVQIELNFRAAVIWQEKLDDVKRATRDLEKILAIDEANVRAARQLSPIYEEKGDAKKLSGVLDILLNHLDPVESPMETRDALMTMARIQERDLKLPENAFGYYAQAFALAELIEERPVEAAEAAEAAEGDEAAAPVVEIVAREDAFADLERVADELGVWDEVVSAYTDRLGAMTAGGGRPEAIRELRLRLGRILNNELGRADEALGYYEEVLAEFPDELRALSAEESIFERMGDWDRLMEVYDRKLALTGDAEERIGLLLSKAMILEEQSGDYAGAVGCYREVLELAPEHRGALQSLHRLYELLDDSENLAEILRREIALQEATPLASVSTVDGEPLTEEAAASAGLLQEEGSLGELMALKLQLGQVAAVALSGEGSNREAVSAFRDVLAVTPEDESALVALEELGREPSLELEVANILEPLYAAQANRPRLVEARETQLRYIAEEDTEARLAKLLSIGQTHMEQGEAEGAFDAYGRALRVKPDDATATGQLEQIADAIDRWAPLVELQEEIVVGIEDPELRHTYLTRVATQIEGRLDDLGRAQAAWRRVLDESADDAEALSHLESLYHKGSQWTDLLGVYNRQMDLALEAEAKAAESGEGADTARGAVRELQFNIATLHEEMLEDPQSAIEIYRSILEEAPKNLRAAQALDRLLAAEGRFDELADNLTQQLAIVEDEEERLLLKCRLANLKRKELGEVNEAIQLYTEALEADPANPVALEAMELLVREEPDYRMMVADVLEPLYREHEMWDKLVDTYEIRLELLQDPGERVSLLHGMAGLHENKLGEDGQAFRTMSRALAEDLSNQQTMQELYRLADKDAEKGEEQELLYVSLAEVLEEQVQRTMDPDQQCDLNMRIAAIQEERLEDSISAVDHYRRVLGTDPTHKGALNNLERLYTRLEEWRDLVEILLEKVLLTESEEEQRELYHRAATLFEMELNEPERAIEMLNRVLELDEFDSTAIDALERLYLSLSRWEDLVELGHRKIRMAERAEDKREHYFVIGSIYETELLDTQRAIETYRAILDLNGEDTQALEALDRLYESTEQWHELLEVLEKEIQLAGSEESALNLRYRVGELWQVKLVDPAAAIEVYRQILETNPEHEPTTVALEGLIESEVEAVRASQVLEPIYRESGQWQKLVNVYELQSASAEDPARRAELLKEIGQIYEFRLDDPMGEEEEGRGRYQAFDAYCRAMEATPSDEGVLDTLERLSADLEIWEALVDRMDEQLGNIVDYDVARNIALRIARILEQEVMDFDRAIDRYRMVREYDPMNEVAIQALDRLYEREGRWHELAEILREEVEMAQEPAERTALSFRLGMLYETALQDVDQAIGTYRDILSEQPEHTAALESLERMFENKYAPEQIGAILEPIYRERSQWDRLAEVYQELLSHQEDPFQRFEQLQRLANLYREQLGDPARCFETLGRALRERPGDEETLNALEQLSEELNLWTELANVYADVIEAAEDPFDLQVLWLKLATVFDERLREFEAAEEAYLHVLEMDPASAKALGALDRIYTQQERWEELAEVIIREIELSDDDVATVPLRYRLGQLYEQQIQDSDRAVLAYQQILEIDPNHGETLTELENIYLMTSQWEPLYDIYERQSELLMDDEQRQAEVLASMANLADQMLGRPYDAIDLWMRVLDRRPEDMTALSSLAHLYAQVEQPAELANVLERQLSLTADDETRKELLAQTGRMYRDQLYDDDKSLESWQRLLEIDRDNEEALRASCELYRRNGRYEELVQVLERMITLESTGPEDLKAIYTELGDLQGRVLLNINEAIEAWRSVLQLDPSNQDALDNLERLFSQEDRWVECVDILDRKVEVIQESGTDEDGVAQIELLLRIAEMCEHQVGDKLRAIGAYEAVTELDPSHMHASQALESLYIEQDSGEYWEHLVGLYLERREYLEDPFDRLDTLRRAAGVYEERLGQPEAAFLVLCSGFLESHTDEETANDLERLARQTNQWDDLITLYMNVLAELDDPYEQMQLRVKLARWQADEMGDLDGAIDHYRAALDIDPENMDALAAMESIFERTGRWTELVGVIQRRANLTPEVDLKIELLRKVGDIWDIQLETQDAAIEAFLQILEYDGADLKALQRLEQIYDAMGAWENLIEVLDRQAAVEYEPERVVDLRFRAASLWEHNVQDPVRAVDAYREVLAVEQTHGPSLKALERLYEQLEQWHDLLDIYDLQLSLANDPAEQVSLHTKAALVYENYFQDAERAIESYSRVLMAAPDDINAVVELERLYEHSERWSELVETYERHLQIAQDPTDQINLLMRMGVVYRDCLVDIYRAIESYNRILEVDPRNAEALTELAALYEMASDWEACLRTYDALSNVVTDLETGVEIQYKMGRILEDNLSNLDAAEERYRFALELEPAYKPAIESLRTIYERRQEWPKVILMLRQEEEFTPDLDEKSRLFYHIGAIYQQHLGDATSARESYEQAMLMSPQNADAAAPLADMFLQEERWERAEPLLDLLVKARGYDSSNESLYMLYYNLGRCHEELGRSDLAQQDYKQAYELEPNHLPTLQGLGRLMYKDGDLERAFQLYQSIAFHHADSLSSTELGDAYFICGDIKRQQGDAVYAQQMFEKAIQLRPDHIETLDALIAMSKAQGDWQSVVEGTLRKVELRDDPVYQFTLLNEIGDIWRDHLGDPSRAVEAYNAALEAQPGSVAVLRKLLDLYTRGRVWTEAIRTLQRLTEQASEHARVATYFYTIAVIYRDELGDAGHAVEFLNKALDADPMMLKAFEAIDRMLTTLKDWKALERSYRKMLHRVKDVPEEDERVTGLKLLLWKNLGEIYRSRQNNFEAAIESFRIASAMSPNDADLHEILADLYSRTGSHHEEAIVEHKKLIAMNPFRIPSYRAMFNAYMKLAKYDEAWCMASALSFLQNANQDEEDFYKRYLGQHLQPAKRQLTAEQWKILYHPSQDMLTSNIMGMIAVNMRRWYSRTHKEWGLHKRRDLLDLSQQIPFCKIYEYAKGILGVNPAPQVYLKKDGQISGMMIGNLDPAAFIVGNDMFQGKADRELAFYIGRNLALARPEHYLAGGFFPTGNLLIFFLAAMQMSSPNINFAQNNEQVIDCMQQMQKMIPGPILMQLQGFVQQFLKTGKNADLSSWRKSVDHTTNRVGMVLCGDLRTAANVVKNDAVPVSKATPKDKIREMVVFWISDEHFKMRKQLGLALGQ